MPFRRRGSYGRNRGMALRPIDSMKNVVDTPGSTGTTIVTKIISIAKDAPVTTVSNEVSRGSTINNIWLSLDVCGLAATGVLQTTTIYLMKNPGDNLTEPNPNTVGSSNEKKFIFKQWSFMTMRNQDGNNPNHWEGWIKVPKRYRRQGTDDKFTLSFITTTAAGHFSFQAIYKWFR